MYRPLIATGVPADAKTGASGLRLNEARVGRGRDNRGETP
jgi:hypothetical protein